MSPLVVAVCLLSLVASAAVKTVPVAPSKDLFKKKAVSVSGLLAEVEEKYTKAVTLSANFVQLNHVEALDTSKQSSGRILVRRPDKIRWETQKPDSSLLVSDGQTFWSYTPPFAEGENGQVIIQQATQVQSKLANALLAGSFSSVKGMKIEKTSENDFILIPKKGTAGSVSKVRLHINQADKLIDKVVLEHRGGNRTEITLSDIQLGAAAEESLFNFQIPKGTDVIKN